MAEVRVFPNEGHRAGLRPGQWSAERLGMKAKVPSSGLSTRLLRKVSLGHDVRSIPAIIENIRSRNPALLEPGGDFRRFGLTRYLKGRDGRRGGVVSQPSTSAPRRGRPPLAPLEYARFAKRYAAAVKQGSRHPARDVRDQLQLKSTTVRARLSKARALGYLTTAGGRGCRGGVLTEVAKQVLAKRSQRESEAKKKRTVH